MYKFRLSQLLKYDNIAIQCHDHPDGDAISSAFGVYSYLKEQGKDPVIVYSGFGRIRKPNILKMIEWFNIPVEYIKPSEKHLHPELLICVDCQYGQGNVAKIEADAVAVIDHHLQVIEENEFDLGVILPQLGSCATLVWDLLCKEDFDFSRNVDVTTALYYGLLTDTNEFSEINHPLDKDMRDLLELSIDRSIVKKLRLCNLTLEELEIAGVAMLRNLSNNENRYALFKSEFCDPNILGFISDIAMQVDTIELCVVYNIRVDGAKLSVRSCSREVMASEFAEYITKGVGSGGGHREKAGGWIQKAEIDELGMTIEEYMRTKLSDYFKSYDLINSANHTIDPAGMKRYRKKPIPKGFVVSSDVFPEATPIVIRTLEGDSNIRSSPEIYLMVGTEGEVYPIKKEKFLSYYRNCDETVNDEYEYEPAVKNEITGEIKKLKKLLKFCISVGEAPVYATPLTRNTKVFTSWNPDGYMHGEAGDFLVLKCEDINDVYIVQDYIFYKTYEEAE
ncbi:MAG: DHH family phosphoesterase [Oscillospiraceae bacterium]|nr:DHH family phosphoesterase [Oscillospiraceae bacterium]